MSYFRAQKARKTSPRSISSRLDSTQKVSRKRGRVTLRSVPFSECLIFGVQSTQDVYIVAYYNTGVTSLNTSSPGAACNSSIRAPREERSAPTSMCLTRQKS